MKREGEQIRRSLSELALQAFRFDLDGYLGAFERSLWGISFRDGVQSYQPLFGNPDVAAVATLPFVPSQAGYRSDIGHELAGVVADLFLIHEDRLSDEDFDLNALLVHELTHLLTDPDLRMLPKVAPDPKETEIVQRLKRLVPADDWYHDERFFSMFVAGCRRVAEAAGRSLLDTVAAGLQHEQWLDVAYLAQASL